MVVIFKEVNDSSIVNCPLKFSIIVTYGLLPAHTIPLTYGMMMCFIYMYCIIVSAVDQWFGEW